MESKYSHLNDPVIATAVVATPVVATSSTATPYLEVIAPATLPEGYEFEVEAPDGTSFQVQVPMGGVKQGQAFSVPFDIAASSSRVPGNGIPTGHWRDDLCGCCKHGPCHQHLWSALCCRLIAIGQVMERMKLNWHADDGEALLCSSKGPFSVMLVITVIYFVIMYLDTTPIYTYQQSDGVEYSPIFIVNRYILALSLEIFSIILIAKTRRRIRDMYNIPETQCSGCEDCCCAYWCGCCTIAQMARHTADYETYAGQCCTATGLGPNAPEMLPSSAGQEQPDALSSFLEYNPLNSLASSWINDLEHESYSNNNTSLV